MNLTLDASAAIDLALGKAPEDILVMAPVSVDVLIL